MSPRRSSLKETRRKFQILILRPGGNLGMSSAWLPGCSVPECLHSTIPVRIVALCISDLVDHNTIQFDESMRAVFSTSIVYLAQTEISQRPRPWRSSNRNLHPAPGLSWSFRAMANPARLFPYRREKPMSCYTHFDTTVTSLAS